VGHRQAGSAAGTGRQPPKRLSAAVPQPREFRRRLPAWVCKRLHAFWFVALLFTLGDLPWLAVAASLSIPVYAWLAMRRVYRDRWWTLLLRSGVLSLLYLVAMTVAVIGVALGTLLS
jgi:hypothetical protein